MDDVSIFDQIFDDWDKVLVSCYQRNLIDAFSNLAGVNVLSDLMSDSNIDLLFWVFSEECGSTLV